MTINDAKQIKLADYLQSLDYTPVKQQGKNLWYKSPLRNETDASFKVNTELNQWYDFGIGKGGNIIALAAELYHSDNVAYLLARIAERTPYIRPAAFSFGEQQTSNHCFEDIQVGELSSPALIAYFQDRGINIELAKREYKELRFEYNGKPYFSIGFPNMAGGYELRNRYLKDASLQRILPIFDSRASHEQRVTSSRGLWITSRISPFGQTTTPKSHASRHRIIWY